MPTNVQDLSFVDSQLSSKVSVTDERAGEIEDSLRLDIEDDELVDTIDERIKACRKYYETEYDLYNQRKKNEIYRFGRQIAELEKANKLKDYESKGIDNVIYEIESTIKPLAMTQLPDLLVTPGNQSDTSRSSSELLTQVIDSQIKNRNNRIVLAGAFQHRPVYRLGVIKCVWNPELAGGLGDYEFIRVHPDCIDFDHTCTESDTDKMSFVSQLCHDTVEGLLMKFPRAKDKFIAQLQKDGIMGKSETEPKNKAKATQIEYREVWLTSYKKSEDGKYQRIEGTVWKYKDCILGKMKNPNFDYEGEEQMFTYEEPGMETTKRALRLDEMMQSMFTGQYPTSVTSQQVYNNYFKSPRKPYYFMTYESWGKQPLDETTHLEQNIKSQEILDKRTKQINETLDDRGHHVWSKESGLKGSDIEKMDHNNPDEDYLVDGDVVKVHKFIEPDRPTQQEFGDVQNIRDRMFSRAGANAVRGNIQSEVATTNQIAREANYTRADDLVDDTINPAAEWMAQWALQMIKLRYTQEHFAWLLGKKGEQLYIRLHQNMVEQGMEVMIRASGTDKIKAQNNAQENARMQLTDPLTYFKDMGYPDAELRTVKLIMFTKDPLSYLAAFVKESEQVTPDLIEKLQLLAPPQPPPMPGSPAGAVQQPTPQNTAQVPTEAPQLPAGSPRVL